MIWEFDYICWGSCHWYFNDERNILCVDAVTELIAGFSTPVVELLNVSLERFNERNDSGHKLNIVGRRTMLESLQRL